MASILGMLRRTVRKGARVVGRVGKRGMKAVRNVGKATRRAVGLNRRRSTRRRSTRK